MDTANLFSKVYPCLHNTSQRLPITQATYMTERMPDDFQQTSVFIAFYNDSDQIVAPTAGEVKIQVSPIEGQWHDLNMNGTIMANTVGATASYVVPQINSLVRWGRVVFNNQIAGNNVEYARAFFWRGISA